MTIVLLTAVPVAALVDDEEPVVVRVDPGPSPGTVVPSPSPTPEPSPSPQPAPSPSPSPAPQPAPTRRPAPPAPKPAPPPTTGPSVEISEAGIWVVDTADRSVRRLADAGPFDVAGDKVLVARGMSVYEVPVAGGDTVLRYTVPSLAGSSMAFDPASEAITMIEAAPDGSAVVASLVPVLNAEGQKVGATGGTALVDPTGAIRSRDLTGTVEWSDDGSLLAVVDYRGLRALRPDGAVAWGPVAMGTTTPNRLTWGAGNGSLAWEVDAHRLVRYDVASGSLQEIPALWRHFDFGPDGRAIGQRLPAPDWTGFTHPGVAVWDPATGATTPFTPGGYDAVWSPGGSKVWMLDAPLSGSDDGSRFSLRIYDAGAGRIMAVGHGDGLSFGREVNGPMGSPPVPGWAAGDRHLVVEVHTGLP